jgi:structural maintenance of chromosome 4
MSARKNRKRKHSPEVHQEHQDNQDNQNADGEELNWSDDEGTHVDGIYIPAPAKRISIRESNTRLIIRKISNNFFKSYAQEQDLGPFSKVCCNCYHIK